MASTATMFTGAGSAGLATGERTGLRLGISGGGTGGHIVPGLHLLEHLRESGGRLGDLVWFGSGRGVEGRVLQNLQDRTGQVPAEVLSLALEPASGGAPGRVGLAVRTAPSVLRARQALRAHRTQVVLGLGGYVTAPVALAARSLGIPMALLEINSVVGKANQWLGPLCRRVYHAWDGTLPAALGQRHLHVGPPVSPRLEPTDGESSRLAARDCLGFDTQRPLLVVLGGSQGAQAINRILAAGAGSLVHAGVSILHQVGPGKGHQAAHLRSDSYTSVEYVDDVPLALRAADVVLCRGGASTLAEVGAVGVPAWVVPYTHHRDNHQEHNARQLGDGVRLVPESSLASVLPELPDFIGPRGAAERERMRRALRNRVPRDSARRILDDLEQLANGF
jgi:UDP-N-acetylglucosamine--N-acetylmuramyl-(pentapeptide) pyrophosphoryl-undecaprenol N-acetylglucosamine transferase